MPRTDIAIDPHTEHDPLDQWTLGYEVAPPPVAVTTFEAEDIYDDLAKAASPYGISSGTAEPRLALARFLILRIDTASAVFPLSFGTVPTYVQTPAALFLARLPWDALRPVLQAVSTWVATAPVKAANVRLASQSVEDEVWDEVVVQLLLDADTQTALSLWQDLAKHLDSVRVALPTRWRQLIDRNLSFHLYWGDDPWPDEPDHRV